MHRRKEAAFPAGLESKWDKKHQASRLRVIFVRHGESVNNVMMAEDYSKFLRERVPDPPLTERGELQAKAVARYLSRVHLDGLYVSPMFRTLQTCKPIAEETGLTPRVWTDIFEAGGVSMRPDYELPEDAACPEMTRKDIAKQFPTYILPEKDEGTFKLTDLGWWACGRSETQHEIDIRCDRVARSLWQRAVELGREIDFSSPLPPPSTLSPPLPSSSLPLSLLSIPKEATVDEILDGIWEHDTESDIRRDDGKVEEGAGGGGEGGGGGVSERRATIALVVHAGFIDHMVRRLLLHPSSLPDTPDGATVHFVAQNCSLTVVDLHPTGLSRLVGANIVSHMQPGAPETDGHDNLLSGFNDPLVTK